MANKQLILFHSPNCMISKEVIDTIYTKQLQSQFVLIDVTKKYKFALPNFLKIAPTIVINLPNGDKKIIEGRECLMYISTAFQNPQTNRPANNQPEPTRMNTQPIATRGIGDYNPQEMGAAWSDKYSSLDNGGPISHSFEFLRSIGQGREPQVSSVERPTNTSSGSRKLNVSFDDYMSKRDNDPYINQQVARR